MASKFVVGDIVRYVDSCSVAHLKGESYSVRGVGRGGVVLIRIIGRDLCGPRAYSERTRLLELDPAYPPSLLRSLGRKWLARKGNGMSLHEDLIREIACQREALEKARGEHSEAQQKCREAKWRMEDARRELDKTVEAILANLMPPKATVREEAHDA
jgi:hypothetical protein